MEVKFEHKIQIESVTIYETYHPGSIVALYAYDYLKEKWICIWSVFSEYTSNWEALNRQLPTQNLSRKFEPNLIRKDVFSDTLRVELEYTRLEYYSELDAIEITGVPFDLNKLNSITHNLKEFASCFENLECLCEFKNNDENYVNEAVASNRPIEYRRQTTLLKDDKRTSQQSSTIMTCSNLVDFPKEILCLILNYLDLKSIFRLRSTCKTFYDVCTYDYLYHKIDLQPYWNLVGIFIEDI